MKKNCLLILVAIASCLTLTQCEKDPPQSKQLDLVSGTRDFNELNTLTGEIASFHTAYMTQFVNNVLPNVITLDSSSFHRILSDIQIQIGLNPSVHLTGTPSILEADDINLSFLLSVDNFINNGYDFNYLKLNPEITTHINDLKTPPMVNVLLSIDNNVVSLIEGSSSFDSFADKYNIFTDKLLAALKSDSYINEYFYVKLFADVYLSSIEYYSNCMTDDMKGPRWEKFKQGVKNAWNEVRPIVAADAGGAVGGAMVGAMAGGVGAGPGAVAGGCGASAGKCVENLINGN